MSRPADTPVTPTGRLLAAASGATASRRAARPAVDASFVAEWNDLGKAERRQIRRLVRIGRPQESVVEARLAVAYAAYQRSRAWYRFFWLWIAPLAAAGVVAGLNLHPIVLGMVLGGVVVAYMSRRNYGRAERVNAELLAGRATPGAAPAAA